jgi:hypothetical protein
LRHLLFCNFRSALFAGFCSGCDFPCFFFRCCRGALFSGTVFRKSLSAKVLLPLPDAIAFLAMVGVLRG